MIKNLKYIKHKDVIKGLDLNKKEHEYGNFGLEKEFAILSNLKPQHKIGKQSTYSFLRKYGNLPKWTDKLITPEVFDFMIEIGTNPHHSIKDAILEGRLLEQELKKALIHISTEFPGIDELKLTSGTLLKQPNITIDNIPEFNLNKRSYYENVVNKFTDQLTTTGQHDNVSIPEPLLNYQYKHQKRGSLYYHDFKNEIYIWLANRMRMFSSLIIAISANTPFTYDGDITKLNGYLSNRWLTFPIIETAKDQKILKDYDSFIERSHDMIEKGILLGGNNYMPVRPKGLDRLGEVQLTQERAKWLMGTNYSFANWTKENIRRMLGAPLNRCEIRCCEIGGDLEFEIAKSSFIYTLFLFLYCNPNKYRQFNNDYCKNEVIAAKYGLDGVIDHKDNKLVLRDFLKNILKRIETFSKDINTWHDIQPIVELSKGAKTMAEKTIAYIRSNVNGDIIPDELLKKLI